MSKKIYLHLLLVCGILCPGIFAKLSDKDTRASSDFLVRKKRVINHLPGGMGPRLIDEANFLVTIKEDKHSHCVGVILSHYSVLTAANCLLNHAMHYKILSGSASEYSGSNHSITSKVVYYGNLPHQQYDGIAMITVDPPFVFGRKTGIIHLHVGFLPVGTSVTVFGWGCSYPPQPAGPNVRRRLRSITLPIINREDCKNVYQFYYAITEKYLCTHDAQQYCALTDAGAPLLFNNKLVGLHVWKGKREGRINPDVFIDLQRPEYSQWIKENAILM